MRTEPVEVVSVMDGQPSLWELREQFQSDLSVVEILDLLHVTPRLWTAAHLFHSGEVIHSLRSRATRRGRSAARRDSLEVICNYFAKNRDRMRYDE